VLVDKCVAQCGRLAQALWTIMELAASWYLLILAVQ
jgi:hypothetical protein